MNVNAQARGQIHFLFLGFPLDLPADERYLRDTRWFGDSDDAGWPIVDARVNSGRPSGHSIKSPLL
jgi:hypothetical protein